jgi:hypothetical protein
MRKASALLALVAAAVAIGTTGAAGAGGDGFSARITNPWFPLAPGSVYVYRGIRDGRPTREVLRVTARTKTIAGAPCAVVRDDLYVAGHIRERTTDWYTQDARGNVWYYGEGTAELDAQGRVTSRSGSWQAGRDGALPGIFMPARPKAGQSFRQEYYKGEAEDHFRVVALLGDEVLLTEEWTPLEPGVLDHKTYVRGVGTVLERTVRGGDEVNELVALRRS